VLPHSIILKKALVGDKSDNIPKSVPRVGNKTLTEIARKAKDINGLKKMVQGGDLEEKISKKIKEHRHAIIRNVELIRLKSDLNVAERKSAADVTGALRYLEEVGVTDIEEKLVAKAVGAPEAHRTL
jgi:5'-3' exonuclease